MAEYEINYFLTFAYWLEILRFQCNCREIEMFVFDYITQEDQMFQILFYFNLALKIIQYLTSIRITQITNNLNYQYTNQLISIWHLQLSDPLAITNSKLSFILLQAFVNLCLVYHFRHLFSLVKSNKLSQIIRRVIMIKKTQVKVISVGETAVGKSSILLRFVADKFDHYMETTIGATYLSKVHEYANGRSVQFKIYDTAGQEKYKSIAPIYYRDSQVALCVYDISSRHSFDTLKNWVKQLKSKGPKNLLLVIVGNKTDLINYEQISYQEVRDYARQNNAIFKLVSAKEGKGVNELFTCIAEQLYMNEMKKSMAQDADKEDGKVTLDPKNKQKFGGICC